MNASQEENYINELVVMLYLGIDNTIFSATFELGLWFSSNWQRNFVVHVWRVVSKALCICVFAYEELEIEMKLQAFAMH